MRSVSLLALLVTLAACDTSGPAVEAPPPVLPLAVGTEWQFRLATRVRFDDTGTVPDTTAVAPEGASTVTLAVTRDTVVAGETWVRIETTEGRFGHCVFSEPAWYANREDGLYRWTDDPAEAEIAYAVGVPVGAPFLSTPLVVATLTDDDALAPYAGSAVEARTYQRTFRRLEFNETVQGPIDPESTVEDALSSEFGPLVLEASYVQQAEAGRFVPTAVLRYERVQQPAAGGSAAGLEAEGVAVR